MGDDLTDMPGISATAAAAMGREQVVLAHHPEHPLAGNTDATTDPKPSPDLAVSLALPGGCLQVGLDGHRQSLVRDRGLRSPALCWWALSGGLLPGFHGVERGTGRNPRPHRPAGGRRPNPAPGEVAALIAATSAKPQRAGRLRLGLQQFHLHDQLPDPLHGDVQFRLHRIALAFLERGIDPGDRLLTPLLEPENLHAQLPRQKFHRLATSRRATSRLRVTVHRWPSPSGPAGETWPGENVDEPSSPSFTTGPSTATLFSKLSVMFRSSLDTSIKPILCPRKSGSTHRIISVPTTAQTFYRSCGRPRRVGSAGSAWSKTASILEPGSPWAERIQLRASDSKLRERNPEHGDLLYIEGGQSADRTMAASLQYHPAA